MFNASLILEEQKRVIKFTVTFFHKAFKFDLGINYMLKKERGEK